MKLKKKKSDEDIKLNTVLVITINLFYMPNRYFELNFKAISYSS